MSETAQELVDRMVAAGRGLIANISSFGAKIYAVNVAYGVGKSGVERLTRDSARELAPHGVTVVSIWPGIVLHMLNNTAALLAQ